MAFADISFGELLLTVAGIFLFVACIRKVVSNRPDLFRDDGRSGWRKAACV